MYLSFKLQNSHLHIEYKTETLSEKENVKKDETFSQTSFEYNSLSISLFSGAHAATHRLVDSHISGNNSA